jgi:methyl-accepting chemotaxis protein
MTRIADMPIRRKLALLLLVNSAVVLSLAAATLIPTEYFNFRKRLVRNVSVLADVIGQNSVAALKFNDQSAATETLASLKAEPQIVEAVLYGADGSRFAAYNSEGVKPILPDKPDPPGSRFENYELLLSNNIQLNSRSIGTIELRADMASIFARLRLYSGIIGLVMLGAIVLTLLVSGWLHRPISAPILALVATARAVSERRDYSVRAPQHGKDEIGLLTAAFNEMLGVIEEAQASLGKVNQAMETEIAERKTVVDQLREQTRQIGENIHVLVSSAGQINTTANALSGAAAETAGAVTETTTTIEEVRHTAQLSSQKAKYVSESAQRAAQISQSGKKSTEQTAEGMSRIREQMEAIADSIVRLSEQSQAIGQIIASVDDLSQHSNLLAVNAAIEAAKAGEHGKGFTVVAQEVKSLAEQSRHATAQVRSILNDIQKATSAAVMATEQGSKVVEDAVRQSTLAGESIVSLATSIAEAAEAAAQIAASSRQQLVGMDQVAVAMEGIKLATSENLSGFKQMEAAAHSLDEVGQRLKLTVEQCKV